MKVIIEIYDRDEFDEYDYIALTDLLVDLNFHDFQIKLTKDDA